MHSPDPRFKRHATCQDTPIHSPSLSPITHYTTTCFSLSPIFQNTACPHLLLSRKMLSPRSKTQKQAVFSFLKFGKLMIRLRNPTHKGEVNGFDRYLRLCYDTLEAEKLTLSEKSLTYRYPLPSTPKKITPGLASALMDELSTHALGAAASPPGASVFFQTQWVASKEQAIKLKQHGYVNIVNTVTKRGRTLAHTKTEFLSPDKELIGHSIHIKYLPTGNIILDTLMKYYPPWLSPWLSELANRWVPPPQQSLLSLPKSDARDQSSEPYAIIQNHLQLSQTLGEAEFLATDRHTNPFGSVHGGCISVLFEIVSESYAKEQLAAIEIHLESIQIQFLSAARPKNKLQVSCETIKAVDNSYILVRVSLTKEKKESMGAAKETKTPLAQGTLKFLVAK